VGRRGPQYAKFTTKELRELGELAGVDVVLDPADLDGVGEAEDKVVARNLEVFRDWSQRTPTGAPRRIEFHFNAKPIEVLGRDRVEGLRLEHPDGATEDLDVQLVLRSAGYRGVAIDGVPFNAEAGTIEVVDHRVVRPGGLLGEYACGWIKRGATGVIGTNRSDATATMQSIATDAASLRRRETRPGSALEAVASRGVKPVTLEGWEAINAAEVELGEGRESSRIKLAQWEELIAAAEKVS
jgi:ferredoxin--NADP+ reductase